eukprot:GILJ01010325.1.p1 GENE.GILJ01010325.1~~GILJ01010325.1.p1  ORF type:complete len:674 (+),score=85.37 GILJ01010325.1:32-2023(+)
MNKKRAWKLQEFVAHGSQVNCAHLGRKSGQVLATGGDDKKVNIWRISKANAIMNLSGHTSAVECVVFDQNEETLVSGSHGGGLKIWDLETQKAVRNHTGHHAKCSSVDFHVYGICFASGSLDTNVKIWDVRRKACIQTYKGHTREVTVTRFSPDGRWVVSGGEDGVVKVWDLTAGRLMFDFHHDGPVTALDFHPEHLVLASGSADRTVKFWDLGQFRLLSSTDVDATKIRAISFLREKQHALLSATQEGIKAWSWTPSPHVNDSVDIGWRGIVDIYPSPTNPAQLIGAAFNQTFVSLWVVDLSLVQIPSQGRISMDDLAAIGSSPPLLPPTSAASASAAPAMERKMTAPPASELDVPAVAAPRQRVQPPVRTNSAGRDRRTFTPPDAMQRPVDVMQRPTDIFQRPLDPMTRPAVEVSQRQPSSILSQAGYQISGGDPKPMAPLSYERTPVTPPVTFPVADVAMDAEKERMKILAAEFGPLGGKAEVNESEILSKLGDGHRMTTDILMQRLQHTRMIRSLWGQSKVLECLETLKRIGDRALLVDFLRMVGSRTDLFSLDACVLLLPQVNNLLAASFEEYRSLGIETVQRLLKGFSTLIIDTRKYASTGAGIDLSREERLSKCNKCHDAFQIIYSTLQSLPVGNDIVGRATADLKANLDAFFSKS